MSKNIGVTIRRIYRNKGIKVSVKDNPAVEGEPEVFTVTLVNGEQSAEFEATRAASWPNSVSTSTTVFTVTSATAAPVKVEREKKEKVPKEKKEKAPKAEKAGKKGKKAPKVDLENDQPSEATLEALAEYADAGEDVELEGDVPNTLADFKAKSVIVVEVEDSKYTFVRLSSRVAWEVREADGDTIRVTPEVGFKTYKGMMGRGGEVKFTSNI